MILAEIIWNEKAIMWVMIFSIPIITVITTAWSKVEQSRSENDLKRSMIERGMSVDDIERVISARVMKK